MSENSTNITAKIRSTSATEAAAKFGVCGPHLTRLARDGKIPASRLGKVWRFDVDELAAHFEQEAKSFWNK